MVVDQPHDRIEPLFAHNMRLWLRVWGATQAAALVFGTYLAPVDTRLAVILILLVAYHAAGVLAHAWLIRRLWAVLLFVPIGWVLIIAAVRLNAAYAPLVFGAVIQGFIFLPFGWAAVTLGLVVLLLIAPAAMRFRELPTSVLLNQIGAVFATGIMFGTVLLYIHRANREAAVRADLLARLDAAQRDLADRAHEAGVLEERQRLSRDIHDTLAQAFARVIRHLEAVQLALGAPDAPSRDGAADRSLQSVMPHLAHAQAVSRDSLAEIRRLVWALRPAELTDAPLSGAIGRIVKQWADANGVHAESSVDPLPPLHPDADVIFLRAVQESLSNVARHAGAQHVRVTLTGVDGLALLTVEDDGRGFEQTETTSREKLGISGMRERVRRYGGHVLIESSPGGGTSLTVAMPLAAISSGSGSPTESNGREA